MTLVYFGTSTLLWLSFWIMTAKDRKKTDHSGRFDQTTSLVAIKTGENY